MCDLSSLILLTWILTIKPFKMMYNEKVIAILMVQVGAEKPDLHWGANDPWQVASKYR